MNYCSRCVYPKNHPLGLTFDSDGICSGCKIHEEKDILDWHSRYELLKILAEEFRRKKTVGYDCVVPVSGARDSFFIVHVVKNMLGLNPLVVSYNKHYNTHIGLRNLSRLRIAFDVDHLSSTCNPEVTKEVTRWTLTSCGSMYWHCLAGETAFPVQVAVKYRIPLIIWGAHQGIDQVGMFSHEDEVEMTRRYRKEHDLLGYEAEDIAKLCPTLTEKDLEPFIYPNDEEISRVGVRGVYLNNYIRWDTKSQHERMINLYGYETKELRRTFDSYNNIHCAHYTGLHDHLKWIKHGYSNVTDHACREIRLGRLVRSDAVQLVRHYESMRGGDFGLFSEWLGVSEGELDTLVNRHRNLNVWEKNEPSDTWQLRAPLSDDELDKCEPEKGDACSIEFRNTTGLRENRPRRYWLFARAFNDGYTDEDVE